jgi:curved DNA-binding protein CbpA
MRPQRSYYEILGLPRTASTAQIKKRYRELARKYHPDVAGNIPAGAKTFVEITEAYKTLTDPGKRRSYDAALIDTTRTVRPGSYRVQPGAQTRPRQAPTSQVRKLVSDAEFAVIRRRLNQAAELCKEAIKLDPKCAPAHAILGDIYRLRRLYDHAINEYNYAIQFDPSDRESQAKLEKLLARSRPITYSWETPEGKLSNEAIILNIIGWGMAFFLLFLIYIYPGRPISGLAGLRIPFLEHWTWNLIGLMFGDGVLIGFLLGANGLADHPDDELIFEPIGRGWSIIPTGILLLVFPPFFFIGAAAVYLLIGFAQGSISKSVLRVFAATMTIVLIAALMYPLDRMSVVLFGGNVVFVGALAGWYLGAILRPER